VKFSDIYKLTTRIKSSSNCNDDVEVSSITKDSRKISDGVVYFATKNNAIDGHKFIQNAIDNGASALVAEDDSDIPFTAIPTIIVEDASELFATTASEIYGNPSKELDVIGIT
jgi:UDP-N-acetylmuramoyl-L-alanyl-D-glutamate--2,6-diaminopimelate ligase